jgi:hypothetical protein
MGREEKSLGTYALDDVIEDKLNSDKMHLYTF